VPAVRQTNHLSYCPKLWSQLFPYYALWNICLGHQVPALAQENAMSVVRDNTELNRFEMDTEADLAIADYRLNGFTMTIYHPRCPHACADARMADAL
jgi:hypothetical protein